MMNKHLKQGDSCPKCEWGILIIKTNHNYQPFLSCDSFPDCRFSANLMMEEYKKWLKENT